MNLTIPYHVLRFTRAERLADRFLSSEIHPIESRGNNACIIVNLEIVDQWNYASQFGQQIVNTIIREYSRSQSQSDLVRFEQALKIANHTVTIALEKLNSPINCGVVLIIDHEIHFATIGNSKLLLFRNQKLSDISNEGGESQLFSSVTSGDLSESEWLIGTNNTFASFLNNFNKEVWLEEDPEAVATQIIETAMPDNRETFAGILLCYRGDEPTQHQTVNWNNLEHVTPIKLPKLTLPQIDWSGITEKIAKLGPVLNQGVRKISQAIKKLAPIIKSGTKEISKSVSEFPQPNLPKITLSQAWRWQLMGLVIFVALLAFGVNVFLDRIRASREEAKVATLTQEIAALPIGQRANFLNSKFDYEKYSNLAEEEKAAFATSLSEESIAVLDPGPVISQLPENIIAIDSIDDQLMVIDSTGQLWRWQNNLAKIGQASLIQSPSSIVALSGDRTLVGDKTGNIWLFDGKPDAPKVVSLPASIATGEKKIGKFSNNLYIYHAESRTIFRQANFGTELNSLKSFIAPELLLEPIVDFAINGDTVALDQTGMIRIIRAGKPVGEGLKVGSTNILRVNAADESDKIVFIADALLGFANESGSLERLTFVIKPNKLSDLSIDQSGKNFWLAIGKEIYRVPL